MTGNRDDRVLPATRALAVIIVPFLLVAFVALYGFPGDTAHWFAWPVKPPMTPLLMGAGYIAGAYFFARVALERRWHRVHLGFLPITAFTTFMAIATFAHLDRFDKDHAAFWIWTALYVVTPVLVPLAWWCNRATDPRVLEPGERRLPPRVRMVLASVGTGQATVALALLMVPSAMVDIWPWTLTPLTSQVLGGWFALPAVVGIGMAVDGRWSAVRIVLESQAVGIALILLGAARAWDDFDTGNALSWVFVGGLGCLLAALLALWAAMERRPARIGTAAATS
jgi:hypothetical protein